MRFSVFWLLLLTTTVAINVYTGLQLRRNHMHMFYQPSLKPVFYVATIELAILWQVAALICLTLRKETQRFVVPYLVSLACVIGLLLTLNELVVQQIGIWIHQNYRNSPLLTWTRIENIGMTLAFGVVPVSSVLLAVLFVPFIRWVRSVFAVARFLAATR